MKWGDGRWGWLYGPITGAQDAAGILRDLSKGWYALAAIQAVLGLILYFSWAGGLEFVADAALLAAAGYFLTTRKSRALAIAILVYALLIAAVTAAARLGMEEGGRNVILAIFAIWLGYRGVRASFVYHARLGSKTRWLNVAIVTLIAAPAAFVVGFVLAVFLGDQVTEEEMGWIALAAAPITAAAMIAGLTYRFRFAAVAELPSPTPEVD